MTSLCSRARGRASTLCSVLLLSSAAWIGACDSEAPATATLDTAGRPAAGAPTAEVAAVAVEPPTYRDSDFVDSERNRDPFRSFATELRAKEPVAAQRSVIMPDTPIDAMRLIAIISGITQPRAMLVDEKGVGYVTARGDFVGRADVVQGGGTDSIPIALNWRVDRIRDNEVVLAREDPSAPNRPPLTRIIPLHDKGVPGMDDQG